MNYVEEIDRIKMKKQKLISLKYGNCYGSWIDVVFYIGIISSVVAIPLIIILGISEQEYGILPALWFPAFILIVFIYIYRFVKKAKKHCKEALQDAVPLTAQAFASDHKGKVITEYDTNARLSVKFYFNEKKKIITSDKPSTKAPFLKKNLAWEYDGQTVNILYSEKNDHVFIIKD